MRRALVLGLVLLGACLSGTSPTDVNSLVVFSNASPDGVFVGDQVQLNAEALDFQGNALIAIFTYTSSNPSVATVNASGLITALAAGTTTIGVTAGGQKANLSLTVDGNISHTLVVTPANATVAVGKTVQLQAGVTTLNNNPARNKTVTWSTADATKATVDATGLVTGRAPSTSVSICATVTDGTQVQGCTSVAVTASAR